MARPLCDTPIVLVVRRKMEGEEEEEESGLMEVLFVCVCVFGWGYASQNLLFSSCAGLPLLGIDSVVNFLLS
jgi:hypothetical protein